VRTSAFLLLSVVAVLVFASVSMAENITPTGTWVKPMPDDMGGTVSRLDGLPTAGNPWYNTKWSTVVDPSYYEIPGQWNYRNPYWADNDMGYQGDVANSPLPDLKQVVTGLDPSRQYEVSLVYWYWHSTIGAKLDGAAAYGEYDGTQPNTTSMTLSTGDIAYQTVLGTVSNVSSYQVDIEGVPYALGRTVDAIRWVGTAYVDIGPAPPAPEPSTLVLLGSGLLGLLAYAWRKRR
jgi:hypothetical protein